MWREERMWLILNKKMALPRKVVLMANRGWAWHCLAYVVFNVPFIPFG
jgi:hypothetical protein